MSKKPWWWRGRRPGDAEVTPESDSETPEVDEAPEGDAASQDDEVPEDSKHAAEASVDLDDTVEVPVESAADDSDHAEASADVSDHDETAASGEDEDESDPIEEVAVAYTGTMPPPVRQTARARLRSFATSRPVAVLVVFLAAVVFGFFSLKRLPVNLMPELTYPTLTVRTEYPGAAPEEVENDISRPIEEALGVVGGLQRISSISRAGVSDVVLEFTWDTEVTDATQDVLERLDLVFLPQEAERPLILHYDPSLDPVMELSLSGAGTRFEGQEGLRRLRRLAELQVKRSLEPIKGVAAVRIRGGLEEEIHVLVDEEKLSRTGQPIQRVIDRLGQENINVAGGTIKEGTTEYMVRTLNEYTDIDQIGNTILALVDGREVRIRDVADVVWAQKEREILTRTDGGESVQIDIFKEADANIVALATSVKAALGEFDFEQAETSETQAGEDRQGRRGGEGRGGGGPGGGRGRGMRPDIGLSGTLFQQEGAKLQVVADRSVFIESSINEVKQTAILGGLLAVLVLFLFLRDLLTTIIVAVSIPISILITFAPLNLFGVSLNIMSLGGLALGIGMLVDSSIVVLESIFRCREEGDDIETGSVRGTLEVRGAVIASTLTSIAVFFPMVFVEGIAGQAFGDLGIAVVVSLIASLIVAIFFIPMLASRRWSVAAGLGEGNRSRFLRFNSWTQFRSDMSSGGILRRIVLLPWHLFRFVLSTVFEVIAKLVLGVIALVLFLIRLLAPILAMVGRLIARPFLWAADKILGGLQTLYPRVLRWGLRSPVAVLAVALAVMAATGWIFVNLESELLPEVHQGEFTFEVSLPVGTPLEETDAVLTPVQNAVLAERDNIKALIVTLGFDAANSQRSDEGEHSARFKVVLDTADPVVESQVIGRIRERLAGVPDVEARVTRPVLFSSKTPIEVEIHGDDLRELKDMASRVRNEMASMPELGDVEATLKSGAPEVQIVYDRERLSRYDLNLRQVADLVRNQVKGFEATRFNRKDRRIPVVVRLEEADRETVGDVEALVVNPGSPRPIALGAVAAVSLGEGPSEVRRIDGRRVAVVNANIASGSLGGAVAAIESRLSSTIDWPLDMTFYITGQNEEWERSKGSLWLALALSLFLVYVIMAAQFENLMHPLVIMFTIPLAFIGTGLALELLGISLSIVVFLGMIMLAGIVVNNAIVLVDYVNTLRRRGMERDEAIVTAGTVRLRPILMTTATTVLGLLPMAFGLGDGAEIRTPMAIAVISGLITSTGLTLIIIPSIYAVFDRIQDRLLGGRSRSEDGEYQTSGGGFTAPEAAGLARERAVET